MGRLTRLLRPRRPQHTTLLRGLQALAAGLAVAASMPPWGWWPLAFLGLGLWERLIQGSRAGQRWRQTWLFTVAWFAPAMAWMWQFTIPGFLVVLAIFGAFHGSAAALVPTSPGFRWRWLALPAAFTCAEALRFCFPFGGVPLASLPMGQVSGPLAGLSRIGGPVLLTFVTALIGTNARRVLTPWVQSVGRRSVPEWGHIGRTAGAVSIIPLAILGGTAVPSGTNTGRTASIAVMQGGGPQGTRAVDTGPRFALERLLKVSATFDSPVDLVIWPENIVNVNELEPSREFGEVLAEARRIGAPISVGITEDADGGRRFANAQVVILPDGTVSSRYEKKRRVPFGEYMPARNFLAAIGVPTNLVPRDAVPGRTPGVLGTPIGPIAVAISWEIFFGGRGREGVREGGVMLTNPTNGSSYRGTILQSQQIASSRLRAIESGRWVAQVAPTGFSAFVSPSGRVVQRIGQGEGAWRLQTVELRTGLTWYHRLGDKPFVGGVILLWALPTLLHLGRARRRRSNSLDDHDTATTAAGSDLTPRSPG